jgi:hypothetical protein
MAPKYHGCWSMVARSAVRSLRALSAAIVSPSVPAPEFVKSSICAGGMWSSAKAPSGGSSGSAGGPLGGMRIGDAPGTRIGDAGDWRRLVARRRRRAHG